MKKTLLISLLLIAFSGAAQEKDYSLARVGVKSQGVYMFFGVEPYHPYTYVATIKVKVSWSGTISENFDKIVQKAKKKYPYFNGVVFKTNDLSKADLVRFEEEITRGGFSLNQQVSFIKDGQLIKGTIVELESGKNKASVQYSQEDDSKVIEKVKYGDLNPIE